MARFETAVRRERGAAVAGIPAAAAHPGRDVHRADSRRGRPRLRLAAWCTVWDALPHNPVMAARY
jgi:hypothetical protein